MPSQHHNWQKPSPEIIELFNRLVPQDPSIVRRKMFGFPCAFIDGHMFAWIHQNAIALRLPEVARHQLVDNGLAEPVDPTGKRMREYIMIGRRLSTDHNQAALLVDQAIAYAVSLPPKPKSPSRKLK